ncbi:hypothetical protein T439DRAFT_322314 [Meredithblackwellia eburnea MCA 4105]
MSNFPIFTNRFSRNTLVQPLDLATLDKNELKRTWEACTGVKQVLEQGSRYENLSWRIWHMERKNDGDPWASTKVKEEEKAPEETAVGSLLGLSQSRPSSTVGDVMDWTQLPSTNEAILAPRPRPVPSHLDWASLQAPPIVNPPWGISFMDHIQTLAAQQEAQAQLPTSTSMNPLHSNPTLAESSAFSPPQLPPTFPGDDALSALFDNSQAATSGTLFHSSFGPYQPVTGPLARFLTPSPGPSLLGNFEDLQDGLADFRQEELENGDDRTYESIWKDFNEGAAAGGDEEAQDPFAGMTLAGRSGDATPASVKLEDGTEAGNGKSFGVDLEGLARKVEGTTSGEMNLEGLANRVANGGRGSFDQGGDLRPPVIPASSTYGGVSAATYALGAFAPDSSIYSNGSGQPAQFQLPPTNPPNTTSLSFLDNPVPYSEPISRMSTSSDSSPQDLGPSPSSAAASSNGAGPGDVPNGSGEGKSKKPRKPRVKKEDDGTLAPSKKNRNPHATQLPGTGARKMPKMEATEGHEGPQCSHCQSIVTPLWRRGPDDELLCNACGLYQKLHSKPRPKTFGKGGARSRASNGAAAQAAASATPPQCHNCAATSTPMWRKDPDGNLCCNACSLYYKLHNVVRPIALSRKRAAKAAALASSLPSATPGGTQPGSTTTSAQVSPALTPAQTPSEMSTSNQNSPRINPLALPPIAASTSASTLDRPPVLPPLPAHEASASTQARWRGSPTTVAKELDLSLPPPKRHRADESWERGSVPAGGPIRPPTSAPQTFISSGAYHPSSMGSGVSAFIDFGSHSAPPAKPAPPT